MDVAADAMEAVAAGDEVAGDLAGGILATVTDQRLPAGEAGERDVAHLEMDGAAGGEACGDQILDQLVLAIDRDALAAGERGKVDPVSVPGEADLDPVMGQALAPHPFAQAGRDEDVDGSLLEHPGANAVLDIVAAAILEHDGRDRLRDRGDGREGAPPGPPRRCRPVCGRS